MPLTSSRPQIVFYAFLYWTTQPVLPFISSELGADPVVFGWLTTCFNIAQLVGTAYIGRMIDTKSAKVALQMYIPRFFLFMRSSIRPFSGRMGPGRAQNQIWDPRKPHNRPLCELCTTILRSLRKSGPGGRCRKRGQNRQNALVSAETRAKFEFFGPENPIIDPLFVPRATA